MNAESKKTLIVATGKNRYEYVYDPLHKYRPKGSDWYETPHGWARKRSVFHSKSSDGSYNSETGVKKFKEHLTPKGILLHWKLKTQRATLAQIDEIHWNHNRKMQQLVKSNPRYIFKKECKNAQTIPGTVTVILSRSDNDWMGRRETITHEYGHVLFNSLFRIQKSKRLREYKEVTKHERKDLMQQPWINRYWGCAEIEELENEAKDELAQKLFGKDKFGDLKDNQQWRIFAFGDVLASLTDSEYGFGHGNVYRDPSKEEAFANIYLAYKYGWKEFKAAFPRLWEYMEELLR